MNLELNYEEFSSGLIFWPSCKIMGRRCFTSANLGICGFWPELVRVKFGHPFHSCRFWPTTLKLTLTKLLLLLLAD